VFAGRFGLFDVRPADFRTVDLRLVAIFRMRKIAEDERAKVVSSVALSMILKTRRAVSFRGQKPSQPTWLPEKPEPAINQVRLAPVRCSSELQQLSP
jgi:hypothetical protein